jgi:hypothetical protein
MFTTNDLPSTDTIQSVAKDTGTLAVTGVLTSMVLGPVVGAGVACGLAGAKVASWYFGTNGNGKAKQ